MARLTPTDESNARRFAARHADKLRFASALGWLAWDGMRWEPGAALRAMELAKETGRSLYADAAKQTDDAARQRLVSHAQYSCSKAGLTAMLELARSEPALLVLAEQLDADSWLLNCQNGTLDLRTGELRAHRVEDLITKVAGAAYEPDAKSSIFDAYRARVFGGDRDLEMFVQRACGYCLTGSTAEEVFFVAYGGPASGKTTIVEAMSAALGDYATPTPIQTFLRRRNQEGPRNDLARLVGSRLVTATEVPPGQYFDEASVKQLTGGDRVPARFLYREYFDFTPAFKIWIAANHRPRVRDDDPAIWRRILAIPFKVEIPKAERQPQIKQCLRDPARDGRAVLAWAVEGCLAYQRDGLAPPRTIQQATAEYRDESDTFGRFLEDCAVLGPAEWTPWEVIAAAYRNWCARNGNRYPLGEASLRERLRSRDCAPEKGNGVRGWKGIRFGFPLPKAVDSRDTLDSESGNFSLDGPSGKFPKEVSNTVPLSTEDDNTSASDPRKLC